MTVRPTYVPPGGGEFRLGHVFASAWDLFVANFSKFFPITLVVGLPNLLVDSLPAQSTGAAGWDGVGALVGFVLNMVAQAMILYIAFQYLRGQPASLADAAQKGVARLFPILGTGILFVLGAWVVPLLSAMVLGAALIRASFRVGVFLASIGMMIVLAGLLTTRWVVAIPVCVLERLGPIASLVRSAALTKGHRWTIFGILLILLVTIMVVGAVNMVCLSVGGRIFGSLANVLVLAVWAAYFNSVWAMLYHDLRVAKEGVDVDQIAAVFD
jgi:hypothetical protein